MATWLGRFQAGDWVPLVVRTRNSSGVITAPTSTADKAPIAAVYSSAAKVENIQLSPVDRSIVTGLFAYRLRLSSSYSTGHHLVAITYTTGSGGYIGSEEMCFQIVSGGDSSGNVVSMCEFLRPEAEHVVFETDAGTIYDGRGPS
jgi:hypothetical protein